MKDRLTKTIESLRKNGFKVEYFPNRKALIQRIRGVIKDYESIGIGGSQTLLELGIISLLEKEKKNILYHGFPRLSFEEKAKIRIKQLTCDLFLSSANAITEKGQIVNTDAIGNRVCAMVFGPKKILIVAGINKIVKNLEEAMKHIKRIAAPLNAKRLNLNTPCAKTGVCVDCESEERICRITVIMEKRPKYSDIEVFVVGEKLGF
jgi:L-lactate utilization protein LutB